MLTGLVVLTEEFVLRVVPEVVLVWVPLALETELLPLVLEVPVRDTFAEEVPVLLDT